MQKFFLFSIIFLITISVSAQNYWKRTSLSGKQIKSKSINLVVDDLYTLDFYSLKKQLKSSPLRGTNGLPIIVYVPTTSGKVEKFSIYHAPIMEKEMEDEYGLYSYAGIGLDDKSKFIRFSISPTQFNSMIIDNSGKIQLIDPYTIDGSVYSVRERSYLNLNNFNCTTIDESLSEKSISNKSIVSDQKFRTYRLALSVTGEYTQYFGGVNEALQQINTTLTRVNGIFEKDLTVNLKMINNISLIYTDPSTDPYSNSRNMDNWNMELQKTLTSVVGENNYDIGHLFGAKGGGGNAGCIGCICVSPKLNQNGIPTDVGKGSGYTSPANDIPSGDDFDIDFVAHEIGHQLGANHTFSHYLENTDVNKEPGSGSTIMGYAGITDYNVQSHSDSYFHSTSIQQISSNLQKKNCGTLNQIPNHPPNIKVGAPSNTIPIGTRFYLDAEGTTDPDGDELSFCWEQNDNAMVNVTKVNSLQTSGPIFRSFSPTSSTRRYFPALASNIHSPETWETVSDVNRFLNFTVTVRDNNPNRPQTSIENKQVIVSNIGGPFIATFPIANYLARKGDSINVTWNVANTTAYPINTQNVKISLLTDENKTITPLIDNTPNSGKATVYLPSNITATKAKIMIEAIDNIFFATTEYFSIGYDTICKNYAHLGPPLPIPINTDMVTTMDIDIPKNKINGEFSIRANVDIDYPNIGGLEIKLENYDSNSNNYKSTNLWKQSCSNFSKLKVAFDDAGNNLDCTSPISGRIKPHHPISSLYRKNYSEKWRLNVHPTYQLAGGTLNSFSLDVCEFTEQKLGTEDIISKDITFTVYPNPSSDIFNIDLGKNSNKGKNVHVKVYDMSGTLIFQKVEKNQLFSIDLTDYRPGVYIINISGKGNPISKSIIKK